MSMKLSDHDSTKCILENDCCSCDESFDGDECGECECECEHKSTHFQFDNNQQLYEVCDACKIHVNE